MLTVKDLIEGGVHFGHRASRWHPNMQPFIHGKHNQIHIIDVRQTMRGIIQASHFLNKLTEAGHESVFVGTKPQAKELVREHAERSGMHFVANRWLGGTLTNFHTVRSRLRRLEELEKMEEDGSINLRSKKEISSLRRERRKIHRNLEGIRRMARLPGAVIVVDIRRDHIAVSEAKLMGIPVVAIVDTDCNPLDVDLVIAGNDDAYRSIEIILKSLSDSIVAGRDKLVARQEAEEKKRLEEERSKEEQARKRAATPPASKKPAGGGEASQKSAPAKGAPTKSAPASPPKPASTNGGADTASAPGATPTEAAAAAESGNASEKTAEV